jgi:hypothetical protein
MEAVSVWVVAIHLIAGGKSFYMDPEKPQYSGWYATKALCLQAPKPPLAGIARAAPFFVTVKGVVCRERKPAKVK